MHAMQKWRKGGLHNNRRDLRNSMHECKCKYVREMSRSAYSRGMENLQSAETSEVRSAMLRHANFKMNITGVFRDDAMLRQITEAVNIRNTPSDKLLNTKKEWNYVSIPRATITD